MDLEGIRLLLRVVELGSIQRTAHALGMSRSSLRRRLENLEAAIGSELFVRSAAGVTLTPAGETVLKEGRAILERVSRMVRSAKSAAGETAGRIVVVSPIGLPDHIRVASISALRALAPGLALTDLEFVEPLAHLHEEFDLMFHFGEPPERGSWFSRVLSRVRLVPLASEAYLKEMGRPSSPADLSKHRLISWRAGDAEPDEWPLWSGGVLAVAPILSSHNGQVVHRAAQDGLGIVLGNPDPSMLPTATRLLPVLDDVIGREVAFRCLTPTQGDADPRTRAVLDALQGFLRQVSPAPDAPEKTLKRRRPSARGS